MQVYPFHQVQTTICLCFGAFSVLYTQTFPTFHSKLGASAIFVDEDKHNDEKQAGEASQAHGDGHLQGA